MSLARLDPLRALFGLWAGVFGAVSGVALAGGAGALVGSLAGTTCWGGCS